MEQLAQEIKAALEQHFAGADASGVQLEGSTDRIGGLLLWGGFAPLTHRERQRRLFDFLRDDFGADSAQVSLIFAYTPQEYRVMQAA